MFHNLLIPQPGDQASHTHGPFGDKPHINHSRSLDKFVIQTNNKTIVALWMQHLVGDSSEYFYLSNSNTTSRLMFMWEFSLKGGIRWYQDFKELLDCGSLCLPKLILPTKMENPLAAGDMLRPRSLQVCFDMFSGSHSFLSWKLQHSTCTLHQLPAFAKIFENLFLAASMVLLRPLIFPYGECGTETGEKLQLQKNTPKQGQRGAMIVVHILVYSILGLTHFGIHDFCFSERSCVLSLKICRGAGLGGAHL